VLEQSSPPNTGGQRHGAVFVGSQYPRFYTDYFHNTFMDTADQDKNRPQNSVEEKGVEGGRGEGLVK